MLCASIGKRLGHDTAQCKNRMICDKQQEKEKQSAALIIEIDGKQRNVNDTRQQMLPERHINNQETDKKEEKQSAAEKYRSIVMVGQYIAKFVE